MNLWKRLGSMALDHILMVMIVILLCFPLFIFSFFVQRYTGIRLAVVLPFVFVVYFCKDFLNGKSPAKRLLGLQVVDIKSQKPPSVVKCFVRNLTVIIWPVEVIFLFFLKERRLGDFIAGTKVVDAPKEPLSSLIVDWKRPRA